MRASKSGLRPLFVFYRSIALRKQEVTSVFQETLASLVEDLGYEPVGVEVVKESGLPVLRVYIDSLGGIGVDDCTRVSRHLSEYLDTHEDIFPTRYTLEVSSPGLERPLFRREDYRRFAGRKARLKLSKKIEGKKQMTARLEGLSDEGIRLLLEEGTEIAVPFEIIVKAHLVFDEAPKGQKGRKG
ncbi:ribosome maturation factor RimP [Aminirod propionatiphilus]|uniref:Ribosome maturation factor RimP n=1 Tax=Aminirod propionatiphilus TaxID=3415223 RepID=A0ACD1DZB0_9BACT|nr:ribosome maturation factor RimP [Synergistota bacterium]